MYLPTYKLLAYLNELVYCHLCLSSWSLTLDIACYLFRKSSWAFFPVMYISTPLAKFINRFRRSRQTLCRATSERVGTVSLLMRSLTICYNYFE